MSSNGLIWYYGNYEHPPGEVYPQKIEVRPLSSDRGLRWAYIVRTQVAGSFVNQSPELDAAGVNSRIATMEQAYRYDYQDYGFKLSNGALTQHHLNTDDPFNLSGNKIVHRSWDNMWPTEFANTRSFTVTLESIIQQSEHRILFFSETTQRIGNGGPTWRLYNQWNGTPVREEITNTSKVYHVQRGTIVGLDTWPTPPDPWWPLEEQQWRRTITQASPRLHGHPSLARATHYALSYTYYFERGNSDPTSPINTWFTGGL